MQITDIDRVVLEWILNALWQVGLLSLVAILVQPLLRIASAHFRHWYWVATSSLCVLIPVLSLVFLGLPQHPESPTLSIRALVGSSSTALAPLIDPVPISVPERLPQIGTWVYLAFLGMALAGFGRSMLSVIAFRKEAGAGQSDPRLDEIVSLCAAVFGVSGARAVASENVRSPITLGFRKPLILVPSEIVRIGERSMLIAVVGHEMAHIKRKDFLVNLLAQFLVIPVRFHPMIWYLISKMRRQCELACDEMVTASLMSKRLYARHLLEVAAESIKGGTMRPQMAFGTDSLEERIKALVASSRLVRSIWIQRAVTMLACSILLVTGAGASLVFVRAQDKSAPAAQEQGNAGSEERTYEISDPGVVPPKILTQTIPSYTEEAKAAGVEGVLVLSCIIRTTGRVTDCQAVRSLGSGLDEAAIREIEDNWRFSPATLDGKPVHLKAKIEVTFNLRSHQGAISLADAEGLVVEVIDFVGLNEQEVAGARAPLKMQESTKFQKALLDSDTDTLREKFKSVTWTIHKGNSGGVVVKYRFGAR